MDITKTPFPNIQQATLLEKFKVKTLPPFDTQTPWYAGGGEGVAYQIMAQWMPKWKGLFCARNIFPWGKCAEIFTENLWQTKGSCGQKVFLQIGRSEIFVVLDSRRHFVQVLQKWFAVFYSLQNFAQISIIASIFAQEINFPQSQNFKSGMDAFVYNDLILNELTVSEMFI